MMTAKNDPASAGWHWDKRVPIALIVTIAVQTLGLAFWIGGLSQRVTSLEESRASSSDNPTRIVRLETKIEIMQSTVDRIDGKLDRLIQRPP